MSKIIILVPGREQEVGGATEEGPGAAGGAPAAARQPGIDSSNLHFGRKLLRINFHPQIWGQSSSQKPTDTYLSVYRGQYLLYSKVF
jgi:hypothetical protein